MSCVWKVYKSTVTNVTAVQNFEVSSDKYNVYGVCNWWHSQWQAFEGRGLEVGLCTAWQWKLYFTSSVWGVDFTVPVVGFQDVVPCLQNAEEGNTVYKHIFFSRYFFWERKEHFVPLVDFTDELFHSVCDSCFSNIIWWNKAHCTR